MPKIAFFIELKNNQATIEGADLNIGNPGVGGTQYLFLLTVKVLNSIWRMSMCMPETTANYTMQIIRQRGR